jgi:hypothetical protein
MAKDFSSIFKRPNDGRRACSIPTKCNRSDTRSFDEIMRGRWEELVIRFDEKENDFVLKMACCPGAPGF